MKFNLKSTIVFLFAVAACTQTVDVQTYQEAEDPTPVSERSAQLWQKVGKLESVWASVDSLYSRSEVPYAAAEEICKLEGWRGETLNAQFLLYTGKGVENVTCMVKDLRSDNATLTSDIVHSIVG